MKTLTVKQPWAWLICSGVKNIENRTWLCPKKYIGQRILIHASAKQMKIPGLLNYAQQEHLILKLPDKMPIQDNLINGAIIGSVLIVDCMINNSSVWAERHLLPFKPYNWVLSNPILFKEPILNVKGKLSFWDYPMTEEEYSKLSKQ